VYVSATEPRCSINISLAGNAVHESDFVEINCSVDYRGSWMPVINCTPQVPGELVDETSSLDRVSYGRMMAAADITDGTVISCETTFVHSLWSIPATQQFELLTDPPRYHHTWRSSPIRVFNTTGINTQVTGRSVKVYSVSSVVLVKNVKDVYSWFTESQESHSYGESLAIWNHSVTCQRTQVNAPRLNPGQ